MPPSRTALESLLCAVERNDRRYEALALEWLSALIAHRSVLHHEEGAVEEATRIVNEIGLRSERVPLPAEIVNDPFYSMPDGVKPDPWVEKENVVAFAPCRPEDGGKSLMLSAHLDVVNAPPEFAEAFVPRREDSRIIGRGAADDKGVVVSMLMALKMLTDAGVRLAAPAELHLVIEEEVGGNGALALIRQRPKADGVIVGEPTSLNIHPANRGALWFRLTTRGVSTHMGRAHEGVNAIEKAAAAIPCLRRLEAELLEESRGYPQFERYEYPVQLNIGIIAGGTHPSMVPEKAVIEGGIGFLPNKTLADMEQALHDAIRKGDDEWLRNHYEMDFTKVRNDAYEIPGDHPLPQTLARCCAEAGEPREVFGWNASCDARLYAKVGGMPTVVFGPGDVRQAHATGEFIEVHEVVRAAEILARFMISWCGGGLR